MNHIGTKTIETSRLILRRYTIDDAEAMYNNWANDPEVTKYLTWPPHGSVEVTRTLIADWIETYKSEDNYHWAITLKENGDEPIGDIAVCDMSERACRAHIGYCLGRKYWHGGIMSEALKAVMDFLFDEAGFLRIDARHDPKNPHSGAVMRKCGMKYEATLRNYDWNNQGICDCDYYALLKEDRDKADD